MLQSSDLSNLPASGRPMRILRRMLSKIHSAASFVSQLPDPKQVSATLPGTLLC